MKNEFEKLPLTAHEFLKNIPMHSLSRIELPGGREGMSIREITASGGFNTADTKLGFISETLFWLRGLIGRVFGWDDDEKLIDRCTYLSRLTAEQRARSLIEPGTPEGISRVLYCYENEYLAEIINRTVHCFWVAASERTETGYVLYLAVYVKKLNWFTPVYMALVSPVLKWIIYPTFEKSIRRNWKKAFPDSAGKQVSVAAAMVK